MLRDSSKDGKRGLADRAYHAVTCQCVCGNTLCFVQANKSACEECGAVYIPLGGNQSAYGYPKVSNNTNNNVTVAETFLLDPSTIKQDVLDRLEQVEYSQTFVWEM